jgi:hypothetical protein
VIVSDSNPGARRLYIACGYRETASRAKVKGALRLDGERWLLLTKAVA